MVCGITDKNRYIMYLICSSKPPVIKLDSRSQAKSLPKKTPQAKKCPYCGGADYLHKSSLKCPYNGASKRPKLDMKEGEEEEATTETENYDKDNLLSTNFIHVKRKKEPKYNLLVDLTDPSFCTRKTQFKV
eukprot:15349048-Ditylum_brightwellii.AAC.1